MSSVETQFHVPPFPPFPSAERYVRVGSQDDALQRVRRAVEAWEAISLVIGPPGTGKSLICQMLQKHFSRDREVIVFGDATLESPQSLQRHLLNRLDRIRGIAPTPPAIGDDPQLAIIERIAGSSKEFSGLLLLVDEAQTLRPEVLETIRILTNVMSGGRPRVSAVLLGGPRLDETLALPSLDSLVQRVATRCYLHPLSSDETVHYVREVAKKCGDAIKINIEESAVRSIHRACSGVPRLVNQLMSASISFAGSRNQKVITNQTVDQAWAVLQQLPSPLMDEPELARPVSDVVFGPLDDESDSDCNENHDENHDENHGDQKSRGVVSFEIELDWKQASGMQEDADHECGSSGADGCGKECGNCDSGYEEVTPEFTMQTEVALACDDMSRYGAVSYDCGASGAFDYEDCQSDGHGANANDAVRVLVNSTPTPDELFGEFEEEEPVCEKSDRNVNAGTRPANATVAMFRATHIDDSDDTEPSDLETSLHREILSLRGAAAAPVLWMEDGECEEPVHDDRDLLVIEDDVDVEGAVVVGEAATGEPAGTTMAVDFQSMLAKMRSPKR